MASPSTPVVFQAKEVAKIYQMGEVEVHALRGVDLELHEGEFVVLLAGADDAAEVEDVDGLLQILLEELPLKQAAALAARITGQKKNRVYQRALELAGR